MARSDITYASIGFPPIAAEDARILILGSLPGVASIEAVEYYAHPQNAFWRIMYELFAIDGDYDSRCRQLIDNRIAVWDVLASSVRPGSMDADIQLASAKPNDFKKFFENHKDIESVCFNGKTAERLFRRLVMPEFAGFDAELIGLPSTSPAYATMSVEHKVENWRSMLNRPAARPE